MGENEVFTATPAATYKMRCGSRDKCLTHPITVDEMKRFAAECGRNQFKATDGSGRKLGHKDFESGGFSGDIIINEYNAPKSGGNGDVFNANDPSQVTEYTVTHNGKVAGTFKGKITLDDVRDVAACEGMNQFNAKTPSGTKLNSSDFRDGYKGNVCIYEYNAPKHPLFGIAQVKPCCITTFRS